MKWALGKLFWLGLCASVSATSAFLVVDSLALDKVFDFSDMPCPSEPYLACEEPPGSPGWIVK